MCIYRKYLLSFYNLDSLFKGFSLTKERLLRTSLQCVVYKGETPDARPQLEDCIIGPKDKWLHKRVIALFYCLNC